MKEDRVDPQPCHDNTGGTVTVPAYLGAGVWTCVLGTYEHSNNYFRLDYRVPLFLVTGAAFQAELCSS